MRRSTARLALGVATAVGLVAGAAPVAAPAEEPPILAVQAADEGRPPLLRLVRLDSRSLDPLPGAVDLDRDFFPSTWIAPSPDASRLAVVRSNAIRIVDSQRMEVVASLPVPTLLHGPWSWPRRDRLFGPGIGRELVVVDPTVPRVVEHRSWRDATMFAARRAAGGFAVVRDTGRGSRLVIEQHGPEGPSARWRVARLRSGVEDVRVQAGLPPAARRAVRRVRALVARRGGVDVERVRTLAVTPAEWTWAEPCRRGRWGTLIPERHTGYEVVVSVARKRLFAHVAGSVLFCGAFPAGEPLPRETNLLSARADTSHATQIGVVADRSTDRVFVVSPDGRLATFQPRGTPSLSTVTLRPTPSRGDPFDVAQLVGGDVIALERRGTTELVNTRTGRVRVLARAPCRVTAANGLALVHATYHAVGCPGLRVYASDGRLRFTALPTLTLGAVQPGGRYMYARSDVGDPSGDIYVIEASSGRVLNRVHPQRPTWLLTP